MRAWFFICLSLLVTACATAMPTSIMTPPPHATAAPSLTVPLSMPTRAAFPTLVASTVTSPAAPTNAPSPMTVSLLDTIRHKSSYPIFVPTFVPNGLVPDPPTVGYASNNYVYIRYRAPDSREGLSVLNGPFGVVWTAIRASRVSL